MYCFLLFADGICLWKPTVKLSKGKCIRELDIWRKCSAARRRDYPSPFFFYFCLLRDTCPHTVTIIPLSIISFTFNTIFMTYRPNVNGPCHCLQYQKFRLSSPVQVQSGHSLRTLDARFFFRIFTNLN